MTLIRHPIRQNSDVLRLETRAQRQIPNLFRRHDEPDWKLAMAEQHCKANHPEARLVCSSALYNCGGLVFGSRRVWIPPDEFLQILQEDGYRAIPPTPLETGDVVVYGTPPDSVAHVGMVHRTQLASLPTRPEPEVWVLSKWGEGGEYVHKIDDVPSLLGEPIQYWRFG